MKYIINYNEQGKILGFAKGDTDLNIEVSNAIWFEAQSYNKIIIDGKNISFDKVDWRTAEEIAEYEKSLIPKTITLRQARLYLLSIELLDDLENIISQNRAYQIEWEYSNQIERESPLVKILGQALNLDDTAIDNMFTEASKI